MSIIHDALRKGKPGTAPRIVPPSSKRTASVKPDSPWIPALLGFAGVIAAALITWSLARGPEIRVVTIEAPSRPPSAARSEPSLSSSSPREKPLPARTSPNSEPLVLAFNKVPPRSTYTLPQIPLTFQRRPTPPAPLPSSSSFPSGEISPSEEETTGRESTEGKVGSEEPPFAEDVAHQEAAPERPAAQELTPSQMPSPPLDVSAANRPAASKVPVSEEVPEPVIPPSSTGEKNEESTPPAGADAVSMGAGPREPSPKIHSTPATPEEETGGEPETSDAPVIIPVQKAPRIPLPRPQTDEDLPPDAVTISLGGGTLQSLIGRVTVNGEEAIPGRVLGIGDKIRTERASNATLAIGGAVIEVQPFTRLEILQTEVHSRRNHPLEEYTTLFLERGSLDVVLRRIEGSFTIKTPTKTFTRQSGAFTITQPAKGEPRLVSRY